MVIAERILSEHETSFPLIIPAKRNVFRALPPHLQVIWLSAQRCGVRVTGATIVYQGGSIQRCDTVLFLDEKCVKVHRVKIGAHRHGAVRWGSVSLTRKSLEEHSWFLIVVFDDQDRAFYLIPSEALLECFHPQRSAHSFYPPRCGVPVKMFGKKRSFPWESFRQDWPVFNIHENGVAI